MYYVILSSISTQEPKEEPPAVGPCDADAGAGARHEHLINYSITSLFDHGLNI